ncbi:MAG TPA: cupredoxin domain-containing protein, partial [Rhodothermales bacterium]|nr:cupredoxin domain-containing protein [Rhodothermales bacterium]
MTRLALVSAALLLAACAKDDAATPAPQTDQNTTAAAPASVRMEDGVQVAEITVEESGFRPASVTLLASTPTRLVITRRTSQTCATEVQSPELGIAQTALPMNEAVAVSFTPDSTGTFTFACGMDMI